MILNKTTILREGTILAVMLRNYLFWSLAINNCVSAVDGNLAQCKQLGVDKIPLFTFKYSFSLVLGVGVFIYLLVNNTYGENVRTSDDVNQNQQRTIN